MDSSVAVELSFPLGVYDVEAIKRAAYVLMARAQCDISLTNSEIICRLSLASPAEIPEAVARDFKREVLDQDLRISIEKQTEPMRNAILGYTFSKTGLQG